MEPCEEGMQENLSVRRY